MEETIDKLKIFKIFVSMIIFFFIYLLPVNESFSEEQTLKFPEKLPPFTYKFEYTPSENLSPSDINIDLVKPFFKMPPNISLELSPNITQSEEKISNFVISNIKEGIQNVLKETHDILKEYHSSLQRDFEKIILSKGYKISGPFDNLEDMTFGQKERTLLVLVPEIIFKAQFSDKERRIFDGRNIWEPASIWKSTRSGKYECIYAYEGELVLETTINIIFYEPLTGEKIIVKKISIPVQPIPYEYYIYIVDKASYWWNGGPQYYYEMVEGKFVGTDSRSRALAKALESIYIQQLEEFSKFLDLREIEQAKIDAEKARKLKNK